MALFVTVDQDGGSPSEGRRGPECGRGLAALLIGFALCLAPAGAAPASPGAPPGAGTAASAESLSAEDRAALERAFDAADRGQAAGFESAKASLRSALARTLAEWKWLDRQADGASFDRLAAFIEAHPSWPRLSLMEAEAERKVADRPAADILAWFERHPPRTGEGHVAWGEALIASGRLEEGKAAIVKAWVELGLPDSAERAFLARHGEHLTQADHEARLTRLLWDGHTTSASQLLSRVSPGARALAEARIALQTRAPNIDGIVGRVPAEYQDDGGLLFDRIRWRRRLGRDEDTWDLLASAPSDPQTLYDPERWWTERHIQARNSLKAGKPELAYAMVARTGLTEGGSFADAEWLAGWIALRHLDKPQRALEHFLTLEAGVSTPISKARAFYWAGRAASAMDDPASARSYYLAAGERPFTYYGQLALEKLEPALARVSLDPMPEVSAAERAAILQRPEISAMRLLTAIDAETDLRRFAYELDDRLETPAEFAVVGELLRDLGAPHLSIRTAKYGLFKHYPLLDLAYPTMDLGDAEKGPGPELALVLGLSRQESEFNPAAVSHAGARGLMQLMPATAKITARRHGLSYDQSWLTTRPEYNVKLGRAHLADLLEEFDDSYIFTIAAYNAGGGRVREWIQTYGNPQAEGVDAIDWVELIPFSETRNYVQRVLENVAVYRARLAGEAVPVSLIADLQRGSSKGRPSYAAYRPEDSPTRLAALSPASLSPAGRPDVDPLREPDRTAPVAAPAAETDASAGPD
ncbi:MAG: lytic transglycosylase domain-containing protein, partial [Alphaproteobacteria bacterium]|nr:lytic transglycosylase domain-containing protein [Alphaproteobacteria bacterium]